MSLTSKEMVEIIRDGLRVLVTRDGAEISEDQIKERANNIAQTILINLEEDADEENPVATPARQNPREPGDLHQAIEKYLEFHALDPKDMGELPRFRFPRKAYVMGKAKTTYYCSDKWSGKKVNYFHEHNAGVKVAAVDAQQGGEIIEVPDFIRSSETIILLGTCLGFDFESEDGEIEAKVGSPRPKLYTIPSGKALLVVDNGKLSVLMWGGGLDVRDVGITG